MFGSWRRSTALPILPVLDSASIAGKVEELGKWLVGLLIEHVTLVLNAEDDLSFFFAFVEAQHLQESALPRLLGQRIGCFVCVHVHKRCGEVL